MPHNGPAPAHRFPDHDRRLKNLRYECDGWKRLLGFIREENIHLKDKVSEILHENHEDLDLDEIENFHNRFLKEDEMIGLLRNNLAEADRLLTREIFEDGKIMRMVHHKLDLFRHNIVVAEKQFCKLKRDFNSYLAENL